MGQKTQGITVVLSSPIKFKIGFAITTATDPVIENTNKIIIN